MMTSWDKYGKRELLNLPQRPWNTDSSRYDGLLLVSTKRKHDSGYCNFAVIGERKGKPVELIGYMDDLRLGNIMEGFITSIPVNSLAIDCSMYGVFRIHGIGLTFGVGENLSTTNWWVVKE